MTVRVFLEELCGDNVLLRLHVDRILAVICVDYELVSALLHRPLCEQAEDLYEGFAAYVAFRLEECEIGSSMWWTILEKERALFEAAITQCRALNLSAEAVDRIEKKGGRFFRFLANYPKKSQNLKEIKERKKREIICAEFGAYAPSRN